MRLVQRIHSTDHAGPARIKDQQRPRAQAGDPVAARAAFDDTSGIRL